ncbi:MAG: histidine phosphatase family protein [Bacteroidota bacterium]
MNRVILVFFILYYYTVLTSFAQVKNIRDYYKNAEKANKTQPFQVSFVQKQMGLVDNHEKLKQIILIRHGEPALKKEGWVKREEAKQFIYAYDTVGIYDSKFKSASITDDEVTVIHTSSLNRARHTAKFLFGEEKNYLNDTLFREFERKIAALPNLKLPLKTWLVTSRILWMMGMNKKNIESFSEAKRRAKRATSRLEQLTDENGKVVLVAHGFLNRYLIKNLKKRDWKVVRKGGKGYFATWLLVQYEE